MRLIKSFLWYLFFEDGGTTYYYILDGAGDIQITTIKTPIEFAPKGWRDQALVWERGWVYHGAVQTYTVPLKFVKDVAKILRHLYVNFGTEPNCKLLIEKYNNNLAVQAYETYYLGDLDFSRYSGEKDFVNAEVMEGGFLSKLKAKEMTSIEIPVADNPNRVWVYMDGLEMVAIFNFTGLEQPVDNSPPTFIGSSRENFPTLLWFSTEGYSNGDTNPKGNAHIGAFSQMFAQSYAGSDMITLSSADKWILHNISGTLAYTYNIKGSITIDHINSVASTRQMNLFTYVNNAAGLGTAVVKTVVASGATIPASGTLTETVPFDFSVTLQPNEQLWFWFRHTGIPGEVEYHLSQCNMVANVTNKVKPSIVPALRSYDVGNAIVKDIDPTTTLESTLFTTTEVNTKVLICGDALRGLSGSIMKTNISEFYTSVNSRFNTCLKFDRAANEVKIQDKAAAFDEATTILDLGTVSNFKHYPLTEEMFAKYVSGYNDVKYDGVNGKDEFNITINFQSDLVRVTTEKNMRSDYGSDMYSMELLRGNFSEKVQADSNNDNNIFWLDIEPTAASTVPVGLPGAGEPLYNLNRSGYTITQGLFSPNTAYNIFMSPLYGLLKHGNYINSVLYPQKNISGSKLTYKSASKDQEDGSYLIWVDSGSGFTYDERRDISLALLPDPLFYPVVFEFDCPIPQNLYSVMTTNPFGKIRFVANGVELFGFLLKVQDEPVAKPKQTYKLLCSVSSDLSKLI